MYGTSNAWASSPQECHSYTSTPEYTVYPTAGTRQSDRCFTSPRHVEQSCSNHTEFYGRQAPGFLSIDPKTQPGFDGAYLMAMYPASANSTVNSAQIDPYDQATISPLETRFDAEQASPEFDVKPSFDNQMPTLAPSKFAPVNDAKEPSSKQRYDSLQSNFDSHSSTTAQAQTGRRRGSEYAEPGSARAIYLEKNRKAASKCRSKQKRQQDDLVEKARDVERQNKILKAEVEVLKSGMRDLMELVGQHTDCPDARLRMYVQREADRLASGDSRNHLLTPLSGRSVSNAPSTDKVSSSDGD